MSSDPYLEESWAFLDFLEKENSHVKKYKDSILPLKLTPLSNTFLSFCNSSSCFLCHFSKIVGAPPPVAWGSAPTLPLAPCNCQA